MTKHTLLTSGYGCSCPEGRHVPKEECLEAAQSVLYDIIARTNGEREHQSSSSSFSAESIGHADTNMKIPTEVLDNQSAYSPCGCYFWKERGKIIYADPEDTHQCTPFEWAQLVCKEQQQQQKHSDDHDNFDNDGASKISGPRSEHESREVKSCHDTQKQKQRQGISEQHNAVVTSRCNEDISPSMQEEEEEGVHKVGGFPVNYTLGDPVIPRTEDLCLNFAGYRPFHLSSNPDFCIGISGCEDDGFDNGDVRTKRPTVLKLCHELHKMHEYWYYDHLKGYITNRTQKLCLEVGGQEEKNSPLYAGNCDKSKLEQKWYMHEDGQFQSLFDESFIGVSGCNIVENAVLVVTNDNRGGCIHWLPYAMVVTSQEYGPKDLWAVLGIFVPLLIIEMCIIVACCIHPNNRNRRRAGGNTGALRTSSLEDRRDISIDAISNAATRRRY